MTLNCFPRVRIVHTSSKVRGQIYIPEINWCLMVVGVALILGFTLTQDSSAPVNTAELGNAFGARPLIAVSAFESHVDAQIVQPAQVQEQRILESAL